MKPWIQTSACVMLTPSVMNMRIAPAKKDTMAMVSFVFVSIFNFLSHFFSSPDFAENEK